MKLSTLAGKVLANTAKKVTAANANSTCYFAAYQPKMPKAAEKLCKNK